MVSRVRRVIGGLARFDLRRFVIGGLLWLPVHVIPLAGGLLLQRVLDQISGQREAGLGATLWLCAAFVGVELVRGVVMMTAWTYGVYWWDAAATLVRGNVLRSVLTGREPAAARLPDSSGEAVSRLRDDVSGVVDTTDEFVNLAGALLFGVAAVWIMMSIDPVVTVVLVLPMLVIAVLSRLMQGLIRRLHGRARELGGAVTGFVGDVFTGVLAIKAAGAEGAAVERLREHNRRRRDAAVKDRLATDMLDTATGATVEISIGLMLLLSAAAMRRGDFTVGDLALFTLYLSWLTELPRAVGTLLARLPQAAVATERLRRLLSADEDVAGLTRTPGVWFHREPPEPAPAPDGDRLELLEVEGLTARPGNDPLADGGVTDAGLTVPRGSFTVVTGAVGAGKTTLVRALLGLVPATGTIRWNGRPVGEPGLFMVPGRVSYAGQVPRLFSATLRENLLLGAEDGGRVDRALERAVLERDLAEMPDGLETVIGTRGLRLSGGQAQRAAVARALARDPQLLVVDDVSSALDVATEELLWERIARATRDGSGPAALLVVSHRPAVLRRADRIVVLDRGRVVGSGPLDELLGSCPEMRRLWDGHGTLDAGPRTDAGHRA
ncbi:ATP-binding cassette domain-containing protein [Streptomyces lycii]|uniref:ATP-binding cassette domain-containing protein n=1 Tax=Streptomyces lycii TaxID=2654337 RepID=UPI001F4650D8|nr:ABC transporter ATP-binding protein [Streptomyces lycii]